MNPFSRLMHLPMTWRIPLAVALMMVTVSAVTTERVLDRLGTLQEAYLGNLADAYIDGVMASISPSVLRQDNWEVFDLLERMRPDSSDISAVETVVTTSSNIVLAASNPDKWATLQPLDPTFLGRFPASGINLDRGSGFAYEKRSIVYQGQTIGRIFAVFDATQLLEERRAVLVTLVLTNSALTLLLVLVGFIAVQRMIRPFQVLESHMLEAAEGRPAAIGEKQQVGLNREARQVFNAFNALLQSDAERQHLTRQLAEEEKLASLGRLASGMAHEINNPLGGLMNAVDTLREHGDKPGVRKASLDLLQRGLQGIGEVVQATLATYRPVRLKRSLSVRDFDDLQLLIAPELRKRSQDLTIVSSDFGDVPCNCPSGPVRQALLNLLLNASAASPIGGTIHLVTERSEGRLSISVEDQGAGMPQKAKEILLAASAGKPPHTTDGLGLWIVRQVADELGATLSVAETRRRGTIVTMRMADGIGEPVDNAA